MLFRFSKTISTISLCAVLCLPAALFARSEQSTRTLGNSYFESLFMEITARHAPWPKNDIHINNIAARPVTLQVPQGKLDYHLLGGPAEQRLGRTTYTVAIDVNGKPQGQVVISGDIGLLGNIVCARQHLKRRTILRPEHLMTVRRDISMLGAGVINKLEKAIGQRLTTSLQPGALLYSHLLEAPPLVKRGDLVTIIAQSENLQISAPGQIKNQGARGELIRVKNLMSRKEIFARVVNQTTVAVDF